MDAAGISLPAFSQDSPGQLLKSISSKVFNTLRRSSSDTPAPLTTQLSNLGPGNPNTASPVGLLEAASPNRISRGTSDPALLQSPSKKGFFLKGSLKRAPSDANDLARADSGSPLLSTLAMTTLSRVSEDRVLLDNRNEGSDAAGTETNATGQGNADGELGPDDFHRDPLGRMESTRSRMSFAAVGETLRSNFKTAAAKINKSKKTLARTLPIVDTWVFFLQNSLCTFASGTSSHHASSARVMACM